MAGRGFRVYFDCPELRDVLRNMERYNTRQAVKIENAVKESTKAIRKGVLRRINNHSGYLRQHTKYSFNINTVTGTVSEKAPHAHLVEFGHGGPSPAPEHPTMRPAFEDEKPNLIRNLAAAVRP